MSNEQKTALEVEREKFDAEAAAENKTRTGKGTRVMVGATRGRATQNIKYEAFDTSNVESLPESVAEFMSVTGISEESALVSFLIDGYNDYQYRQASDPIAEFLNPAWPDDTKSNFRIMVRNYAKTVNVSIEDAVAIIKPGVEKAFAASLATA